MGSAGEEGRLELVLQDALSNLTHRLQGNHDDIKLQLGTILHELQRFDVTSGPKQGLKRNFDFHLSDRSNSSLNSNSSECRIIQQNAQKEEIMKEAIQHHITDLADSLLFVGSELPDLIVQHEIATSSESETLRQLETVEDQVSGLVSLVITRDFRCMDEFVWIVNKSNPELAREIREEFESLNQATGGANMPCVVCELKSKCDIKRIYNHFFSKEMITPKLHKKIVHLHVDEDQANAWDEMLAELIQYPVDCVIHVLINALDHNGSFNTNLTQALKRLLRKKRSLKCRCTSKTLLNPSMNNNMSSVGLTELPDTDNQTACVVQPNRREADEGFDKLGCIVNIVISDCNDVNRTSHLDKHTHNPTNNNSEVIEQYSGPNVIQIQENPGNYNALCVMSQRTLPSDACDEMAAETNLYKMQSVDGSIPIKNGVAFSETSTKDFRNENHEEKRKITRNRYNFRKLKNKALSESGGN